MKRINTILIFVLTAITVFPIIIFSQNKISDKAEREKREVQEFTDSFLKQLEKTKDISKVPRSFFADDFFNQTIDINLEEGIEKRIPQNLKFRVFAMSFNIGYLGITYFLGRLSEEEMKKDEAKKGKNDAKNSDGDGFTELFFPPYLLKIYKNSRILSKLNNSENKVKTIQEINELINEMESIINQQRRYLRKNYLPRKNSFFYAEMNNVKNITYWEKDDIYSRIDSNGLKFIEVGGYIIRLRIAKINGKPKILDIFLLKD